MGIGAASAASFFMPKGLEEDRRLCYKFVTLRQGSAPGGQNSAIEEGAMKIQEIKSKNLKPKKFIVEKVREIRQIVGDGIAISALSGGVDSSVVTALAYKALGRKLKTYFIDNGIMREGEPKRVKALFAELGIPVTIVDARKAFFDAMKGITDPELKREAITQTFYKKVFRDLVLKSKATVLLQGTILTDVEETAAGYRAVAGSTEKRGRKRPCRHLALFFCASERYNSPVAYGDVPGYHKGG
jgi:hypothetical protein